MADGRITRPKRQGNYVPERIKVLEVEIAAKYAAGQSAKSLGREYGISKIAVQNAARRQGVAIRTKGAAGKLLRRTDTELTPQELSDERSIAQQVAEKLGLGSSKGLSFDTAFRTACAKERRRRDPELYREIDRRRKLARNRTPRWIKRSDLDKIYSEARSKGLHVDHDVPLQHPLISGLNVPSNMRLVTDAFNWSKGNRFECGPDYTMPPYVSMEDLEN